MNEIPVGMDEAARHLGLSRRTLTEVIKRHPFYSRGGRANVFYAGDLEKLRRALREETWERRKQSLSIPSIIDLAAPNGGFTQSLPDIGGYEEVRASLIASKRNKSHRGSRSSSGNVIPMARNQASPSRRP